MWFTGPAGASADQMYAGLSRRISPNLPASIHDDVSGAMVVVAAPGDLIEISARPEVAADATVTRSYVDAGASDGVVVTDVEPPDYEGPLSVQYRVTRAGAVVAEQTPDERVYNGSPQIPSIDLGHLRPPDHAGQDDLPNQEQQIAGGILSEYGLSADQPPIEVYYIGPLPGRADAYAGLYVLTATFPSGAVLTRAEWIELSPVSEDPDDGSTYASGRCANRLSPAGLPAAERVVALRCDVGSGVEDSRRPDPESVLIVIAPPDFGATDAAAEGAYDRPVLDLAENGVGMTSCPEGVQRVLIRNSKGVVLEEVPVWSA